MIEIKNNQLVIDGFKISLNDINIIHQVKNNLHLSNSIIEFAKDIEIKDVFKVINNSENNFILINKAIVNLDNVESASIKYYQYAGISIYECEKKHAELYVLRLLCKDGNTETISFRTLEEVQKYYQELQNRLSELKTKETLSN